MQEAHWCIFHLEGRDLARHQSQIEYCFPLEPSEQIMFVPNVDICTNAESGQPYPQQKAELDDEESRLYDIAAEESRYEVSADSNVYDILHGIKTV